jgi:hypothetical protein
MRINLNNGVMPIISGQKSHFSLQPLGGDGRALIAIGCSRN